LRAAAPARLTRERFAVAVLVAAFFWAMGAAPVSQDV
jgi:hypothetical protein